jgi:polysaccharide chain length determinant protein (PEP-CTERM system associated)
MDLEQGFDLSDFKRLLRRRAALVLAVAGAISLTAIFIASLLRNVYESWATLLIEPQTISPQLVESGLEQRDVNSRLHLIQAQILSRGRLSRVIDDLGLYKEESREMTREEVIEKMRSAITLQPILPEMPEEILERTRTLDVNTFILSFRHHDAQLAANVTNRLANDFIEEHIKERVQVSGDTSEFIEAELNRLAQRIGEVEARIAAVKSENAGRLPEDVAANQRLLERALDAIRAAERDLAVAESDAGFYRQQAIASGDIASPESNPARALEMLEIELGELLSRGYTDKHPDIVSKREQITSLREKIETTGLDEAGAPTPSSLAQQSAQAEAARAQLRADAARREIEQQRSQAAEFEARLAGTPRVAEQLAALDREHEHLFASYQEFSQKRLEAGVSANMERRQKGEQFRVLEAAYPAPSPISPNRPLIVVLGILVGIMLASGLAFVLELVDTSFHDARRLQDALRLPVLATVPSVKLASDLLRARRRRFRRALAAVAVTGVVLVASVAGNWMRNGVPSVVKSFLQGDETEAVAPATTEG